MTAMHFALFSVLACATCFGAKNSISVHALNMAILTLLGIVLFVLGGFGLFFLSIWKRRGLHS